jgi:hypothetical protein
MKNVKKIIFQFLLVHEFFLEKKIFFFFYYFANTLKWDIFKVFIHFLFGFSYFVNIL